VQPLLQWNRNARKCYIFWVCVCSLSHPACNAHAPYYHLLSTRICNILPHCLINGTILEKKKLLNIKCVYWFSLQNIRNIFYSKKNWAEYDKKMYSGLLVKYPLSFQILMKLDLSLQIFEKYSSFRFHENLSSGSQGVHCGQTDRRDEVNSRVSQFCWRA